LKDLIVISPSLLRGDPADENVSTVTVVAGLIKSVYDDSDRMLRRFSSRVNTMA